MRITVSSSSRVAKTGALKWKARPGVRFPDEVSSKDAIVSQESVLHKRTVPSRDFDAKRLPSLERETQVIQSVWPSRILTSCPILEFQIHIVLSREPETSTPSSENHAKLAIAPVCPFKMCQGCQF